jgi:alpha-1,3-mannosyl-glycoprotein beta-1,2-N-acetylglucosaminyltransferase
LQKIRKNKYDEQFFEKIEALPKATIYDFESFQAPEIRLIYSTKKEFEAAARKIGVMSDLKAGVPRMAYFGVVTALYKNKRVFITPPNPRVWEYHTDW